MLGGKGSLILTWLSLGVAERMGDEVRMMMMMMFVVDERRWKRKRKRKRKQDRDRDRDRDWDWERVSLGALRSFLCTN